MPAKKEESAKRTHVIQVWLTKDEKKKAIKNASEHHQSLSAYGRCLMLEGKPQND